MCPEKGHSTRSFGWPSNSGIQDKPGNLNQQKQATRVPQTSTCCAKNLNCHTYGNWNNQLFLLGTGCLGARDLWAALHQTLPHPNTQRSTRNKTDVDVKSCCHVRLLPSSSVEKCGFRLGVCFPTKQKKNRWKVDSCHGPDPFLPEVISCSGVVFGALWEMPRFQLGTDGWRVHHLAVF